MSRLSRNSIKAPTDATWELNNNHLSVRGRKGSLSLSLPSGIVVENKEGALLVRAAQGISNREGSVLSGTYFRLIQNMFLGVSQGFKKRLKLVGVGYRVELQKNILKMSLGYSHDVFYVVPEGISVEVEAAQKQGDMPITFLSVGGADKQRVGQVVAELQKHRPPEPYKGKGFHIEGQFVRRKESKK